MKNQRIKHRDYFVVQVTPAEIAHLLRCDEFEAGERTVVGGMKLPVVYVIRDEFDSDPMKLPLWFESPLTAKAAIDIYCYNDGFQRGSFWPNYHDVYIAMRSSPSILKAFQELHRDAKARVEDGLVEEDDFAYIVRERLGRCFTEIEQNIASSR